MQSEMLPLPAKEVRTGDPGLFLGQGNAYFIEEREPVVLREDTRSLACVRRIVSRYRRTPLGMTMLGCSESYSERSYLGVSSSGPAFSA